MKKLSELPKLSSLKRIYKCNKVYKICEYIHEADFDKFCEMNNLEQSAETYKDYLGATFNGESLGCNINRTYEHYQNVIYDSLLHSWDCHELIYKLKKFININKVTYVSPNRNTTQFSIFVDTDKYEEIDNERLFGAIHLYNYYIKNIVMNGDNCIEMMFEPYKPKEVTDYVYNNCEGIIYHVTNRNAWNKIKNSEIKPKQKTNDNVIYRDGRSFFIACKDKSKVYHELRQLSNVAKIKDPVYVKVDLNKYHNKLRFRLDSSGTGYKIFTEEPIPCFCLNEITLEDD